MNRIYKDRIEAGRLLGEAVKARLGREPAIVLGLPRGGVPVAALVGEMLDMPVDVLVVRKVGVPNRPELAMGAVAPGGVTIRNEDILSMFPLAATQFDAAAGTEREELRRREHAFRRGRPALNLNGLTVVLVDDGVATGATLRAAIESARRLGAKRVVVAAPVASAEAMRTLEIEADEVVCLQVPQAFMAVGQWYEQFPQVTDAEVQEALKAA
jgi:putative phosphoribosyl transferase